MKVLRSAAAINTEITRLIRDCSTCEIAVAWASLRFEAANLLFENRGKIGRMVVGVHFFQTDPDFIEAFRSSDRVRFVLRSDGVFHPKVYLFFMESGGWECVVGSANFTRGGCGINAEMALLISNDDLDAEQARRAIVANLDCYWAKAGGVSDEDMGLYREACTRKQPLVARLKGTFGNPYGERGDGGGEPRDINILKETWSDYISQVRAERDRSAYTQSFQRRLEMLREVRSIFAANPQFHTMSASDRQKIGGLLKPTSTNAVNFLWFGSMRGSGLFRQAIKVNSRDLSAAMDFIPTVGPVSREAYLAFVSQFQKATPGRNLLAPATRLLAMKRPDFFVCLDARNRSRLCKAFKLRQQVGYTEYWDSIIARVEEAIWWNSVPPVDAIEREAWEARVAFLDSRYYDGKDMPSPDT